MMRLNEGSGTTRQAAPQLRADAERNRARLLVAARDVFVERGADAPLDEVAARAGVGIATLYRRFPDRAALQRAVVLDALRQAEGVARAALAEESEAGRALASYMHGALDARVSAVVPALLAHVALAEDDELSTARDRVAGLQQQLLERAQAAGQLRADVAFADLSLLLIRMARPLPGPFPAALEAALAHRHLDILLDGLGMPHARAGAALQGPALSLEDLRALAPPRRRDGGGESTPDA